MSILPIVKGVPPLPSLYWLDRPMRADVMAQPTRGAEARNNHRLPVFCSIEGWTSKDRDTRGLAAIQTDALLRPHLQRDPLFSPYALGGTFSLCNDDCCLRSGDGGFHGLDHFVD